MKIAIYTLPFTWNYGGILQCYALTHFLEEQGHSVTILNRRTDTGLAVKNFLKSIKWNLVPVLYKAGVGRKNKLVAVESFKQKYLDRYSPLFFETDDLRDYCQHEHFDAVISGSDQIWHYGRVQDIFSSFLDFVGDDTKKLAYAASFGVDFWKYSDEATSRCKDLVRKFSFVSVREASGVDLCSKHLGVNASHVLDPTLLVGDAPFRKVMSDSDVKSDFLCTYVLDASDEKTKFIRSVADELKCSIREASNCSVPSVENWIESFAKAKFVVTDSFHGTCFAILFNKPFITIFNEERGNARFASLAQSLGLQDRFVSDLGSSMGLVSSEINYDDVNLKLGELRRISADLLVNALL